MKFSVEDFRPQFAADLVTFIEEIFNGKLHFLCSEIAFLKISKQQVFVWKWEEER